MQTLELDDIQGYIIRGYAHMSYSRFVLLKIEDAATAKKWINDISDSLTVATLVQDKKTLPDQHLNIAFTVTGLKKLGLSDNNMDTFSMPFREGMQDPYRQRLLGDLDSSSPNLWRWGSQNHGNEHILLMIFGRSKDLCLEYYNTLSEIYLIQGLSEIIFLDGQTLPMNKEHFGFRDGISQPYIVGSGRVGPPNDNVMPGEFLMGYKNEYKVFPDTPLLIEEQGDMNLLSSDNGGSGEKDLGRNGSYLVIRQIEEDVHAFWTFMNEKTKNKDGSLNIEESQKLAAKMMGRWQSGAPITKYPDSDPGGVSDDNDFGYAVDDAMGLKCPFGSHLRRSNPRDSFEDDKIKPSVKLTNHHRIIRRARLYGQPYLGGPQATIPEGEVGLLFNCFNADISRQFEFIQSAWGNSGKVKNLYDDPDPITGVLEQPKKGQLQNFTIQDSPVNVVIEGLKRFVTIRGGAYFFFPSITAVRYLSTL